jgi:hypothetical protein
LRKGLLPYSLPYGKEPLVLLALLQLLGKKGSELNYSCDDLLKLLGWKNTEQTRALIEGTVTKYFHAFYQLRDNSLGESMKGGKERTRKIRVLVTQAFTSVEETRRSKSMKDTLVFNIDFVGPLKERKLLGIDWEQVESFTPLPVEIFNL